MSESPLVTIMIPAYNAEETLPVAVRSILAQTYDNWECVIVNDGSTDGTKDYLESLTDERFVIEHFQENKGRPAARSRILELARGKYLAFLDADDLYHPDKLSTQVDIMESDPDVDLVSCGNASFDGGHTLVSKRGTAGNLRKRTFKYGSTMPVAMRTSLVRKERARKTGFDAKLLYSQDVDFLTRYLHGRQYIIQPEVYYYYSELVSVNRKKIFRTYRYGIRRNLGYRKLFSPVTAYLEAAKTLAKWMLTAVRILLMGERNVIISRGTDVSTIEQQTFQQIYSSCSK